MKEYMVKPEYWDIWGVFDAEEAIVDKEMICYLADEWETTMEELMRQVDDAPIETEQEEDENMKRMIYIVKEDRMCEYTEGQSAKDAAREESLDGDAFDRDAETVTMIYPKEG